MNGKHPYRRRVAALSAIAIALSATVCAAQKQGSAEPSRKKYRGLLGSKSKKIKREGDKVFLWSGGGNPTAPSAQWYDFTDAVIPAGELQFGIGKDRIRAIDDPLFVSPDDPRLLKLPPSPYRHDDKPETNDEIMVIGYANGQDARAYPVGLLDHHELVNDNIGGKPVTVGW